jgi:hypothetical protein
MDNQTNNQGLSGVFIGLGVQLIVLGALFFVGQAAGFALGRVGWPFFVIIPGVAVSGLVAGHPTGESQGGLQAGPRGVRLVPRGVRAWRVAPLRTGVSFGVSRPFIVSNVSRV